MQYFLPEMHCLKDSKQLFSNAAIRILGAVFLQVQSKPLRRQRPSMEREGSNWQFVSRPCKAMHVCNLCRRPQAVHRPAVLCRGGVIPCLVRPLPPRVHRRRRCPPPPPPCIGHDPMTNEGDSDPLPPPCSQPQPPPSHGPSCICAEARFAPGL